MQFDSPFLVLAQTVAHPGGLRGFIDSAARTPLSQIVIGAVILTVLRMAVYPLLAKTERHKRFGVYKSLKLVNELLDAVIYAGIFVFLIVRPFVLQAFLVPSGSMWPTIYVNDFIVANKAIYRYTQPKVNDIVVFRPPVRATYGYPDELDKDGNVTVDFVKRCVAIPGDVIELRDGILYRNGQKQADPHKHFSRTEDQQTFEEMPADQVAQMEMASFKLIKWKGQIIPLNYTKTQANAGTSVGSGNQILYGVHPDFVINDPADQAKAIAAPAEPVPPGFYFMMGDDRNDSEDGRFWGMVPRDSIIGRSEFIWLPISRIQMTR